MVAVITASILLIIAMSIGSIALKEQVLSIANKESQVAFYAADTGMECALYWDQGKDKGVFAPINAAGDPSPSAISIYCNNVPITAGTVDWIPTASPNKYSYTFMIPNLPAGIGSAMTCAVVKIVKSTNDNRFQDLTKTYTDIYSYGYNTCGASLTRLERGIEAHY